MTVRGRLATISVAALGAASAFVSAAGAIEPGAYEELASGVGRVVVRDCRSRLLAQGTGFLVGSKVVMTAHHVLAVRGACIVRVQIAGRTFVGNRWTSWHGPGMKTTDRVDVETIRLTQPAPGHLFEFARHTPKQGQTVAMIGHPAGNPLSLSQGRFLGTKVIQGVTMLGVFLQSAHGASGAPLLDRDGKVIGVLQRGVADENGGVVTGINLVRESGLPRALCHTYPSGGIAACGIKIVTPTPTPTPKPPPVPACLDKLYLGAVGPSWKAGTDAYHAWTARGSPRTTLDEAFTELGVASFVSSSYTIADLCSTGLQQASTLISGIEALVDEARLQVDRFVAMTPDTPEYTAALQATVKALGALGQRIDEVDSAFASR